MAQSRASDSTLPLFYRLDEACVSSGLRDVTLTFLPRNELETLINIPNITAELRKKLGFFHCMWNSKLPEQVYNQARKVFAVLVLIEKVEAICELLNHGLTDEDLPLRLKKDEPGVLESCSATDSRVWKGLQGGAAASQFEETQWRLLAPVLNITGKHFGTSDERFGTSDERIILPIFDIDKEAIQRGMSPVYRGLLHWAHCEGLEAIDGCHRQIAIKEFHANVEKSRQEVFDQERKNLMELQKLNHPHPNLLRHFATCQVGDRCYALFPWADGGTLKDLWKSKDLTPRDAIFIRWCLQQMHDLVDALEALHSTNYRHGDIKPDNILYFTSGNPFCDVGVKQEVLMLADFGVSRKHIDPTFLRLDGTTTKATTASYEAPETVSKADLPRSRQYDMWSTGCVLLEFCVWLLHGCAAVDAFREKRLHASYPMNLDASFYVRLEDSEMDEINPAVKKAIKAMRDDPRCSGRTALRDLLELIQDHLLLIDAEKRDPALKCRAKLSRILSDASENISYLVKTVDPLPDVPDIFIETKKPQPKKSFIVKHDD